jgi:hypothetical protein
MSGFDRQLNILSVTILSQNTFVARLSNSPKKSTRIARREIFGRRSYAQRGSWVARPISKSRKGQVYDFGERPRCGAGWRLHSPLSSGCLMEDMKCRVGATDYGVCGRLFTA